MNWIEKRIKAEKRKHEKWAGDDWIKVAGNKIMEEISRLITEEIAIAHKEGKTTSRLTALYLKIEKL